MSQPPKVEDVWVVFKTHFDIGFTDTIEGVLRRYRVQMMDGALAIIDQQRQLPARQTVRLDSSGLAAHARPSVRNKSRRARPESSRRFGKERW